MDKRVLLVEDNPHVQKIISTMLRRGGYEVETASDGGEGVQAALRRHHAVVLMDADLPVLDGWSATAQIKASAPDLPVVMLTGYSTPEHASRAEELGCDGLLGKPVDFHELLRVVRDCIPDKDAASGSESEG